MSLATLLSRTTGGSRCMATSLCTYFFRTALTAPPQAPRRAQRLRQCQRFMHVCLSAGCCNVHNRLRLSAAARLPHRRRRPVYGPGAPTATAPIRRRASLTSRDRAQPPAPLKLWPPCRSRPIDCPIPSLAQPGPVRSITPPHGQCPPPYASSSSEYMRTVTFMACSSWKRS